MTVTKANLSACARAAHQAMGELEQELNAADARLGDGDTGSMLARLFAALAQTDLSQAEDMGVAFSTLAKAAAISTGSSLGTLVATALLTIGKENKGRANLDGSDMPALLASAMEAMMARGKAAPGDKTILDSLDAVIKSLTREPTLHAAAEGAQRALDDFRSKPNRIGRARMFGDNTIGIDDPGMLAFALLSRRLADNSSAI
ncbi:dihydroxyacetone kinase subunit L [Brucella anthropi]|uniref:dihydroxyacetone kinase subunit L n=1 Tax=Brucella anthropi TaxID=529 RepID=UPI00124DD97E|nr:dihydroxyacetone kinase subunit L [Brucella anthropi]KAB2784169.1 dihydroxyacetone kinase subunit L [Brucella anthropi]KAB2793121.1 dihydroxyacetone kinase subunit L [Brucella anthropi]